MVVPDIETLRHFEASQPQYLSFRFQERKFQEHEKQQFLSHFLQGLILHNSIRSNPVFREVVMLGYGTLVSKYCVEDPSCPAVLMKVRITHPMKESRFLTQ